MKHPNVTYFRQSNLKYAKNDLKLGKNDLKYYDLKWHFPIVGLRGLANVRSWRQNGFHKNCGVHSPMKRPNVTYFHQSNTQITIAPSVDKG